MFKKHFLHIQRPRPFFYCITAFAILLFLLKSPKVYIYLDMNLFKYVIEPGLWLGFALIIWQFPKWQPRGKLRLRESINLWAFNLAFIFILLKIGGGFFDGFGKTPYAQSFVGMSLNLISVGSLLIGREFLRSFLVTSLLKKENFLVFVLVALFMTFIDLPFQLLLGLSSYEDGIIFFTEHFAPGFSVNLLATYLAFLGGPVPALIYIGLIEAFNWFSPILPNLKWITIGLVGTIGPAFSFILVHKFYRKEVKEIKNNETEENPMSWAVSVMLSIAIVWFAVGVFPVYPSAIATGSMEPMVRPGDVVLVKKMDGNKAMVGDVIQFQRDNILISHRIIEITEDDGKKAYVTKGDNNSSQDSSLVAPQQIKGEIIQVVPKLGWPTLLFNQKEDVPEDVEF
ncbi:signal peptidase I [Rossellomorea vietnamensis]|uniref:Signal peptidase I n=1 Tax=Rossellomorea vietnamensis TaxID=218284 RepID=A0A5D4M809_9BACI|nr:signal peptidase I [Rossellomorea vietnamensis]TYR97736.1 signal peptidase I [Rossellomorea vietnamensis]